VNDPGGEPSALVDPGVARGHWQDHERHDGVVAFPPEVLAQLPLPPDQLQYLQQAGLPRAAAPYLTFDDRPPEVLQDLIWEPDPAPRDPYRRYVVLGGDGAGNPIALDVDRPGAVLLLDHDHAFAPVLMHSSIPRLVTSLLVFDEHVAAHGLDACTEVELLGRRLQAIDLDAWAADGWWAAVVDELRQEWRH
jgi:SUKH-4 immunity protein